MWPGLGLGFVAGALLFYVSNNLMKWIDAFWCFLDRSFGFDHE